MIAPVRLGPAAWLFATTIVIVALFIGATVYEMHLTANVDHMAEDIAGNADPSIRDLATVRTELHAIDGLLTTCVANDERDGSLRAEVEAHDKRMDASIDRYVALPFFPTERERWAVVEHDLRDVDALAVMTLTRCEASDEPGAVRLRPTLASAIDKADAALAGLIGFDADQGSRLGADIAKAHHRAAVAVYVLDGVDVALAAVLLAIGGKGTHEYVRALRTARDVEGVMTEKLRAVAHASVAIAGSVGQGGELIGVLQATVDAARAVVAADFAAFGIGSDPARPFNPFAFSGVEPSFMTRYGPPRPVGLLGAVIREGRTIRVDDANTDPRFLRLPPGHPPVGPFLGVVVRDESDIVGHLYFARKPGDSPFNDQDARAAELLASFAGAAVRNAMLNAELRNAVVAREDLLSMVSHDLRNPLSAISMAAQLLRSSIPQGTAEKRQAELIGRNASRMDRLIADLLLAAKLREGKLSIEPKAQQAGLLAAEAIEALSASANAKRITLSAEVPADLPLVYCDGGRIVQVLTNLINNALKFTPEEGSIVVSLSRDAATAGEVHFIVRDTGAGIPEDAIPHLFDRFWQVKAHATRGTGLGLFITKGIVESHGGRVGVRSKVGEGSEFFFTLPTARGTLDSSSTIV